MKLKDLALEYAESARLIESRIKELEQDSTPANDYRIKVLKRILRDTKEVGNLCGIYYEKGAWRSEKYTFNRNTGRRYRRNEKMGGGIGKFKRAIDPEVKTESDKSDLRGADPKAARDAADALIGKLLAKIGSRSDRGG